MKRTPLKRKTRLKSGGSLPPVNRRRAATRRARDFAGDYAEWIRQLPCIAWRFDGWCMIHGYQKYPGPLLLSEAAHVKSRGAGGQAVGNLVPLCSGHHREQHTIGIKSFEKKYGLDLKAEALRLAARYQEENDRE